MITVGITGYLGSGKSTVARLFLKKGAYVIDADKIVHRLLNVRTKVGKRLLKKFGKEILSTSGLIDRKKLAILGFSKRTNWSVLCRIIHPEVIREIKKELKKSLQRKRKVLVIDAPLLIEAGLDKMVDYVILVKANLKDCYKRAKLKLGISKDDFKRRVSFQIPFRKKLPYADFVIDNTKTLKFTERQVEEIWKKIISQ